MLFRIVLLLLLGLTAPALWAQETRSDSLKHQLESLSDAQLVSFLSQKFWTFTELQQADFIPEYERALAVASPADQALLSRQLGVIYFYEGNFEQALLYYQRALSVFQDLNDAAEQGNTLNEMAILTKKQKDYEQSLHYLSEAYQLCASEPDSLCMSTALDNRALVLMEQGNYDTAYVYLQRVLDIRQRIGDSVGLGYVFNNLAEVVVTRGQTAQAVEYIGASSRIRQALGDTRGVIINTNNIGEVYLQAGRYEQALGQFLKSLEMLEAARIHYPDFRAYLYGKIAETYVRLEQHKAAYDFLEREQQIRDSLLTVEKVKSLSDMEVRYQTARKEEELQRQRADLAQVKLQNTRLIALLLALLLLGGLAYMLIRNRQRKKLQQAVLKEKERGIQAVLEATEQERKRISRDLHDGVGQQIGGLKLAMESLRGASMLQEAALEQQFEDVSQILQDTADQIRSISHQMMPRALTEQGLLPAVRDLLENTFAYARITYDFSEFGLTERQLPEPIALTAYRVLQELLNNIVKHAEATQVDIQLRVINERLLLTVQDNGRGFEENIQTDGHGILNMRTRLEAVGGRLKLESEPNEGTSATMIIPL